MFQNIGIWEYIIIGAIILLIFGPKKLPEIGRGIGRAITEFKEGLSGAGKEIQDSMKETRDSTQEIKDQLNKEKEDETKS